MTPKRKPIIEPITVSIRFPPPIHELITVNAAINDRSFNQQVLFLVKKGLAAEGSDVYREYQRGGDKPKDSGKCEEG